jgi:hypothetical protein
MVRAKAVLLTPVEEFAQNRQQTICLIWRLGQPIVQPERRGSGQLSVIGSSAQLRCTTRVPTKRLYSALERAFELGVGMLFLQELIQKLAGRLLCPLEISLAHWVIAARDLP